MAPGCGLEAGADRGTAGHPAGRCGRKWSLTRSLFPPDPERWTHIPLLVKILKLIINELSNVMEANAARQPAPTEWGPGAPPASQGPASAGLRWLSELPSLRHPPRPPPRAPALPSSFLGICHHSHRQGPLHLLQLGWKMCLWLQLLFLSNQMTPMTCGRTRRRTRRTRRRGGA